MSGGSEAASKYAVLSVAGQQMLLGRPLAYVPLLTWTILYAFEWQVLLYWGIVAGYHAMSASRSLERRQIFLAALLWPHRRHVSSRCSAN